MTTPDIAGLCERLRKPVPVLVHVHWRRSHGVILREAANALERQAAEIERLREALEEADARIGVMTGRGERCPQCADTKRNCANAIAAITVDYNRAGAALTGEGP
jgi:hypothetical protein